MEWYEDPAQFDAPDVLPRCLRDPRGAYAGPKGLALVDVYSEGRTTSGWGLTSKTGPGFMENYLKGKFWAKPRILEAERKGAPFAFVMRSTRLVAIDIDRHIDDGGADGFIAAAKLKLPPTLAQTSRSGAGRHLMYSVDDSWDDVVGFGLYDDVIGLVPGVDVRATGCIYRYDTQRWNHEDIAPLPDNVRELLENRRQQKLAQRAAFAAAAAAPPDAEEALIMHDALKRELDKPMQPGKRNTSLFAIGSKMKEAGYPNWEAAVQQRAEDVGLSQDEALKIVSNIGKYNPAP